MTEHNLTAYFATASGVLHNLYFYKPSPRLFEPWYSGDMLLMWPQFGTEAQLMEALAKIERSLNHEGFEAILQDHYRLFIGPGVMEAYPWGSVYTDQENLLFGETAQVFAAFLSRWQVAVALDVNQPMDHIGLVLGTLSQLLNNGQWMAVDELLTEHLMPWAPRFLRRVQQGAKTDFYRGIAELTEQLLTKLMAERQLTAKRLPLYK